MFHMYICMYVFSLLLIFYHSVVFKCIYVIIIVWIKHFVDFKKFSLGSLRVDFALSLYHASKDKDSFFEEVLMKTLNKHAPMNKKFIRANQVLYFFFNCYLAAPQLTLGYYRGDNFTHLILITAFEWFWLEGHRELLSAGEYLSTAECLVGFELGTFDSNCNTLTC